MLLLFFIDTCEAANHRFANLNGSILLSILGFDWSGNIQVVFQIHAVSFPLYNYTSKHSLQPVFDNYRIIIFFYAINLVQIICIQQVFVYIPVYFVRMHN